MMRSWAVTPAGVSITLGTTTARIGLDQREMRLMARQLLQAAEERDARAPERAAHGDEDDGA